MTIDITAENLLTLAQAAASLPSQPHVSTCHRWRLRGIRGVKLETCLIGGRRYTSREAIARFVASVSGNQCGRQSATIPTDRHDAICAAEKTLAEAGV